MDQKEAIASLEAIQTILERSTNYTHVAPAGIIAGGLCAALSAACGRILEIGSDQPIQFLLLWGVAFLVAGGVGVGASAHRARRRGETFWSRKLQFVVVGAIPAVVGSLVLTASLYDTQRILLCPGVWMICYGIAILSVGVVLGWEFRAIAWAFLVLGSAALFVLRDYPNLSLGFAFGGFHLLLGSYRLAMEDVGSWRARMPYHTRI